MIARLRHAFLVLGILCAGIAGCKDEAPVEAERIGDHGENLLELTRLRVEKKLKFSDEGRAELLQMHELLQEQFQAVLDSLENNDAIAAERALKIEDRINDMAADLARHHVKRLEAGKCEVRSGVIFLDVVANLEKVGDHLTNIAQRIAAAIRERETGQI